MEEEYKTPEKKPPGDSLGILRDLANGFPYVCSDCGTRITNQRYILANVEKGFNVSTTVINTQAVNNNISKEDLIRCMDIYCTVCGQNLGFQMENSSYFLFSLNVVPAPECVKITYLGLNEEDLKKSMSLIEELMLHPLNLIKTHNSVQLEESKEDSMPNFPRIESKKTVLTKSGLRNGEYKVEHCNLAIITHRCEGRILLTDRNGLYHDLLISASKATRNRVFLFLIKNEEPAPEGELINNDIQILASEGGQPSLKLFSERKQIMVWDDKPNSFQKDEIIRAILDSYYQPEVLISTSNTNYNSPPTKSLKKLKADKIMSYYTSPEKSEAIRKHAKAWHQKQSAVFFKCDLLQNK